MGNVINGIKGGLISGFIYFIINSIVNFAIIYVFIDEIVNALNIQPKYYSIFLTLLLNHQFETIFIIGIIFGILFSVLVLKYYKSFPGDSIYKKMRFLNILLWVIIFVIIPVYEFQISIIYAIPYFISYATINFTTSLFFAYLLSHFNGKYLVAQDKNTHQ